MTFDQMIRDPSRVLLDKSLDLEALATRVGLGITLERATEPYAEWLHVRRAGQPYISIVDGYGTMAFDDRLGRSGRREQRFERMVFAEVLVTAAELQLARPLAASAPECARTPGIRPESEDMSWF
ncbi:hypothetical protein [Defluviimonas salinarum]|uniref:Uncharacterized protein n=1 Tax=Defluviimonas salinarum TaxID=2992147 RepID=A0ABT3J653_9RHOB|nr:hypothetical protein [Defluviimonas salinarum]MCW3782935.1 hypothetical protein [Defluviimonas salinarum]